MASILIPPDTPTPVPSQDDGQLALWENTQAGNGEVIPHVLIQLEDDLERSRMREAFWISVVVHLMVVILLVMSPKIFPGTKGVVLISPSDLMRNQQMTYLDLPPDMQKAPKVAPKTNVLSDKNRIAESRHPTLDKKTLEELKRAGPPRMPSAPAQQAQMSPPVQQQQPAQQQPNQSQNQQQAQLQPAIPQDNPRLAQQQQQTTRVQGNLEVLSDTEGVDFGPYLSRVLQAVRMNWYNLIPEEARPPLMKKGKVSIEFAILKDGKIAGIKLVGPSGDVSLDRAAWGGITASVPFAPLPTEYHGPYLALRFHFYYNPAKGEIE
jgi:TonB family protein